MLTDVPHISQAPVLMLRPRAWNMVEHNMMVVFSLLYFTWLNLFCASLHPNAVEVVARKLTYSDLILARSGALAL